MAIDAAFEGDFEVEPYDFELRAERFIVRKNGLSFRFEGTDVDGPFTLEGTAEKYSDGTFRTEDVPVQYATWVGKFKARLIFSEVQQSARLCKVVGEWRFEEDSWRLMAKLKKYAV